MLKHLSGILFLFIFITAYSQPDTLKVPPPDKPVDERYDSAYKQFIKDRNIGVRHLWKLNLVDLSVLMPNIGFEQKIGKLWSSDSYIKFGLNSLNIYDGYSFQWSVSQQLKFYYNMNRRERHGKMTGGFSGNYLSLNIFAGKSGDPKPGLYGGTIIETELHYGAGLNYGIQRKIGTRGYFEVFGGISYQYRRLSEIEGREALFNYSNPGSMDGQRLFPVYGVRAGFALESFSNRKKPVRVVLEDNITEVKHVWKLNLVGYGLLIPNCGFEFKIANRWSSDSYLKVGINVKPSHHLSDNILDEGEDVTDEIEFEQQIKYYVGVTRDKNQGQKVHAFSGDYISLNLFAGSHSYNYDYLNSSGGGAMGISTNIPVYGAGIKYGWQRRIGDIGYLDIFTGINYRAIQVPEKVDKIMKGGGYFEYRVRKTTRQEFMPVIGIRAGLALDSHSKLVMLR